MGKVRVFELKLDSDGIPITGGKYIRLPSPFSPYVLRFNLQGASAVCRNGKFLTNYPFEGQDFIREQFYEISLKPDFNKAIYIDIWIDRPGAYAYKIEYQPLPDWDPLQEGAQSTRLPKSQTTEEHYFSVEPALHINGKDLPLAGLAIQSVTGKWMGPLAEWPKFFKVFSDKGYNMIHFTPLNQRGDSNSPYSIYNQLAFSPDFFEPDCTLMDQYEQIGKITASMENDFGLLSLTDVVWNHTAENSDWLLDHPEAGYNLHNSPHLISAYQLDSALLEFSSNLRHLGYPTVINSVDDLLKIMEGIKTHVLGGLRLWEFYIMETGPAVSSALNAWKKGQYRLDTFEGVDFPSMSLQVKASTIAEKGLENADSLGERFKMTLKANISGAYLGSVFGSYKESKVTDAQRDLTNVINEINLPFYKQFDADRETILENIFNRVKYVRLELKKGEPISDDSPLIETLFTRLPHNDRTLKHPKGSLALANNGWIWANNPLDDFAAAKSRAYLRREVIVWSDCVKLRYGSGPEDNRWLWNHMTDYTRLMARHFHGFRIDNCHSTPLHVGAYLLDQAREVRPDIYICAELFTGSEEMDVVFVSHLGISSLIREAMQAWGPQELSRLVHRHGGKPIGSLDTDALVRHGTVGDQDADLYPLHSQPVNPLFFDCTHDNETPTQKRVAWDTLPTGALVTMCAASVGSVMGYDEIFPRLLDLVSESRLYAPETQQPGIGKIKGILNRLHTEMALEGYTETHVHHEGEYITVHRVCPRTHKGYFLIAHTAFSGGLDRVNTITLPGTKVEVILSQRLNVYDQRKSEDDPNYLRGLQSDVEDLQYPKITVGKDWQGEVSQIVVPDFFPPGSIILMKTSVDNYDDAIDNFVRTGADEAMSGLSFVDLNVLLYRCDGEERDFSHGKDGAYNVPGYGPLTYCGLEGWIFPLREIIRDNNLAHPLCNHLRQGYWAMDYTISRLQKHSDTFATLKRPKEWFEARFRRVKSVPAFLAPKLFAIVMQTAYNAARHHALSLLGEHIRHGTEFVQSLAMTSIQLHGQVASTSLKPTSIVPCLAAGLPHFSFDYMRCWGRDVFISARGLFLGTGRYDDAKDHILAFAAMLKHGMIPNLLDAGRRPRYNSRDSIWFFLQLIQDYTKIVPNGTALLDERVRRRFPLDDEFVWADDPKAYSYESSIMEIIQEALTRVANGIHFREAHAGSGLDSQMTDKGFNIDIFVDWDNGLVFGGNPYNCGTWMDKMGESEKAGNKGVPGTPRDGAAIEITGLLKSCLRWLTEISEQGFYKFEGVTVIGDNGSYKLIKWKEWNDKVQESFEHCYFVPRYRTEDPAYDVDHEKVNRRGIYKDLYRSSAGWSDYQFRPNFAIAMVVAPELFKPKHALQCLTLADRVLRGPTGMRTLDPADMAYRPNYINSDDSNDFSVAKGRNYHQGPEWLWCTGFFLRAFLKFDLPLGNSQTSKVETLQQLHARLHHHRRMIESSAWAGLVELTNKDGAVCYDACDSQAWSMGTLLDLMHDTSAIEL